MPGTRDAQSSITRTIKREGATVERELEGLSEQLSGLLRGPPGPPSRSNSGTSESLFPPPCPDPPGGENKDQSENRKAADYSFLKNNIDKWAETNQPAAGGDDTDGTQATSTSSRQLPEQEDPSIKLARSVFLQSREISRTARAEAHKTGR